MTLLLACLLALLHVPCSLAAAHNVTTLVQAYSQFRQQAGCHANLCSSTENAAITNSSVLGTNGCCTTCSCEPTCEKDGSCCPDMLHTFPYPNQYPLGGAIDCVYSQYKQPVDTITGILVISACDMMYQDVNTTRRCRPSPDYRSSWKLNVESYVPVVDMRNDDVYRNYFCAKCNFVADEYIILYAAIISCSRNAVFIPGGVATIIEDIDAVPRCNIQFSPPSGIPPPKTCDILFSTCNETGYWVEYDEFIEAACMSYRAQFNIFYANIFCYICNTNITQIDNITCSEPFYGGLIEIPTFSALLDFRKPRVRRESSNNTCAYGFVYDYYKQVCRNVVCPEMTLYDNGTCRSLLTETPSGLCFDAFIKITPVEGNSLVQLGSFQTAITDYFRSLLHRSDAIAAFHLHGSQAVASTKSGQGDTAVVYYVLHVHMFWKGSNTLADDVIKLDNTNVDIVMPGLNISIDVTLEITPYHVVPTYVDGKENDHTIWQNWTHELLPTLEEAYNIQEFNCNLGTRFVTKVSKCIGVSLNLSKFAYEERKTGIYFVELDLLVKPGSFEYELNNNKNTLHVCVSDYIQHTEKYFGDHDLTHSTDTISGLLTLFCSSLSIMCLVLVCLTYSLFPILRTQPGINNMALSCSLLLAQILFVIGVNRAELGTWCMLIGGMTHFFFLAVIFWMFICCVHMFRVFRNISSPEPLGSIMITTAIYASIVSALSLVFVAVNITVSYIQTSGSNFGYGGTESICYISSPIMIGYTVALPAGLIIVANIISFFVVIRSIAKMPVVQSSSVKNRRYFSIYIRLSTVTGLSWLSVIPYFITDIKTFDYISMALTSSQGVFIFVAFIANRRVLNLYTNMIGMKMNADQTSSAFRTSGSMTQTSH